MKRVEDKRAAILAATLKLISENGFHGTAMSRVAREAGVSAGIIYHYFASKDDLIDELYKSVKCEFGRSLLIGIDETQPLREQIRGLLRNTLKSAIEHPREVIFMEQYAKSPY